MPEFVYGGGTIDPKTDYQALPGGVAASQAMGSADWAVLRQALFDTRAAITAIAPQLGTTPLVSTVAVNLFVSPTGSDTTGDGSSGNPYQTLSHALSKLPLCWTQSCQITLMPGTHLAFAGTIRSGVPIGPNATPLQIVGTPTIAVGPVTSTGGSTTTVIDSGLAMTVSAFRGARLRFITGPNAGISHTIWDNTATTVTISSAGFALGSESAGGSSFVIETMPVVPNTGGAFAVQGGGALTFANWIARGDGTHFFDAVIQGGVELTLTSFELDMANNGHFDIVDAWVIGSLFACPYIHNGVTAGEMVNIDGRGTLTGQFQFRSADILCIGGTINVGGLMTDTMTIYITGAGRFFHQTAVLGQVGSNGNGVMHAGSASSAGIVVDNNSVADLKNLAVNNMTGDGIRVTGRGQVSLISVTGTGNSGHGVVAAKGARVDEISCSITGTGGDVLVGATTYTHAALVTAGGAGDSVEFTRVDES